MKFQSFEAFALRLLRVPAKDDPDPVSGYGFELTFRLKKAPENNNSVQEIPIWPCKLLQHLAKYVFKTGTQFHAGHHIPFGQTMHNFYPSTHDTLIRGLLITTDRQLQSFRTNLGSVEFLQVNSCRFILQNTSERVDVFPVYS